MPHDSKPKPQCVEQTLILFEPEWSGHRMNYVRALVDYAQAVGKNILLATCSETLDSEEYRSLLEGKLTRDQVITLGKFSVIDRKRQSLWVLQALRRISATHSDSQLIVLEGDKIAPWLALAPWKIKGFGSLLFLRDPHLKASGRRWKSIIKQGSAALLRSRGFATMTLQPGGPKQASYMSRKGYLVPDPIELTCSAEDITQTRAALDADLGLHWLGILGHITARKNLSLIIEAASGLPAQHYGVLIAGKIDPTELRQAMPFIDAARKNGIVVKIRDEHLSSRELDSLVSAVDVLVLANSSEGPSGMLGKAGAAGTMVVAAGSTFLRGEVARLNAGTWVPLTIDDLRGAFMLSSSKREKQVYAGDNDFARAVFSSVEVPRQRADDSELSED